MDMMGAGTSGLKKSVQRIAQRDRKTVTPVSRIIEMLNRIVIIG